MQTLTQTVGNNRGGQLTRYLLAMVSVLSLLAAVFVPTQAATAATASSVVSAVSPTLGLSSGGTQVTITGSGLAGTSSVQFGGSNGTSISINGAGTSVTVNTPSAPQGSGFVDVKLTTSLGDITIKNGFRYKSALTPAVTSVTPNSGFAAGYNTVTIAGTNFDAITGVNFGNSPAISFTVNSDRQITAIAPPGAANSNVAVSVTTAAGTQPSVATYKYRSTMCTPMTYTSVAFANRSATLTTALKNKIRSAADDLIALGCDEVNVVRYIDTYKGASASFKKYLALSKKRFDAVYTVLSQAFNAHGASIRITAVPRANQISQSKAAVWDSNVAYRKISLTVTRVDSITGIYPPSGTSAGGNTVTITGTGFDKVATTGAVRVGGVLSPAYTVNAAGDTIVATVPAGIVGTQSLTVQLGLSGTAAAKLLVSTYSYVTTATISSASPSSGPLNGGTAVTITGSNFDGTRGVSAVLFGNSYALSYTVSGNTITAITPAGTSGAVPITVVSPGGTAYFASFTYVGVPSITSVTPPNGPTTGTNSATIAGTNLTGLTSNNLRFGLVNAISLTVNGSGTSITAAVPNQTARVVDIAISGPGGNVTLNSGYRYGALVITYNTRGADSSTPVAATNLYTGSVLVAPTAPTKSGSHFAGWYKESNYVTPVTFPYTITELTDFTLYARWGNYSVTYNTLGGSFDSGVVSGDTAFNSGESINLPTSAPAKTGSTFDGWSTSLGGAKLSGTTYSPSAADITLYARWIVGASWIQNGATTARSGAATYIAGTAIDFPTAPLKTGYDFAGWSLTDGGTALTGSSYTPLSPYAAVTFYAKWTAKTYNVAWAYPGATTGADGAATYVTGATIALPTAPTKTGTVFSGWTVQGQTLSPSATTYTPVSTFGDITFTATWTAIP